MYKALITDLDGTAVPLASNGESVSQATRRAIQRAVQSGSVITCASGRAWNEAKDVIAALGITSPCIIEGGTRIINPHTEETLWQKSLTSAAESEILHIFHAESDHGQVMHSIDPDPVDLVDVHAVPPGLRFLYLLAVDEAVAIRITNTINQQPHVIAHLTPSWDGAGLMDIHVTHRQATKEHAIAVWQDIMGVSPAETIGMGDSGNDVPIFQRVGLKVAVENATPELKALADYIAPSVDNDALRHVIGKFL